MKNEGQLLSRGRSEGPGTAHGPALGDVTLTEGAEPRRDGPGKHEVRGL